MTTADHSDFSDYADLKDGVNEIFRFRIRAIR
jgi:hypothetical protein